MPNSPEHLEPLEWHNERRRVSELQHFEHNPRTLSEDQSAQLKKSLEKFNLVETPAINTDGMIVSGHQRTSILIALGRGNEEIDVRVPNRKLTDDEFREFLIRANLNRGEFDFSVLANEFDTDMLMEAGFTSDDLGGVEAEGTHNDAAAETDRAAELQQAWSTETGQIWQLGKSRLIIGDSTDDAVIARLFAGEEAEITFTSPPYNLGRNIGISNRSQALRDSGTAYQGGEDSMDEAGYLNLLEKTLKNSLKYSHNLLLNVQMLAGNKKALLSFLANHINQFADVAVWHKTNQQPAMAENVMNSAFEFIFFFSRNENPTRAISTGQFRGTFDNVYTSTINHNEYADVHGAAFPLEFATHFIKNFSTESVFEPFCGTGTTILACHNTGRKCFAAELSPNYAAVICDRFREATGETPTLVS